MSARFSYTARTSNGVLVRGKMQASDRNSALSFLRTRSLFITSLESERSPRAVLAGFATAPVRRKDVVALFRALSALVSAGVPLRRALQVTIEQTTQARLREALRSIAHGIENGLPLSRALALHPSEFSALQIVMVRAGEVGGSLDVVLARLAETLEREQAVYKRLIVALTYPAFVASAAVGLVLLLFTSVLPMFSSLYDQMKVQKPPVMQAAITVAALVHSWQFAAAFTVLGALAIAFALRLRLRQTGLLMSAILSMPIVGPLMRKAHLARIARMLGTLLRCGVDVVSAMDVVQDAVNTVRYRQAVSAIRQSLDSGLPLSGPMERSSLFDPLFVQMVRVGEETGALDEMLVRIADYYDLDVETAIASLTALVEPALLLLIGFVVAGIAATVFIPLYSLIGSIR